MLVDADLVELEEAAGGLGDHVEEVRHLRPGSPHPHDLLRAGHIQQVGRHEIPPAAIDIYYPLHCQCRGCLLTDPDS